MFEFKVVRAEVHDSFEMDKGGKLKSVKAPCYTFHVSDDGGKTWVPSLKWYRECTVKGLAKTYYIDRCINRLKAGASREAFGSSLSVSLDNGNSASAQRNGRASIKMIEHKGEMEMVAKGGKEKPREKRPTYKAFVDNQEIGEFPSEQTAKGAAAIYAFMTRGKLGRIHYARTRLMELIPNFPPESYKVWACTEEERIRAKIGEQEYSIAWIPPGQSVSGQWEIEYFKSIIED